MHEICKVRLKELLDYGFISCFTYNRAIKDQNLSLCKFLSMLNLKEMKKIDDEIPLATLDVMEHNGRHTE